MILSINQQVWIIIYYPIPSIKNQISSNKYHISTVKYHILIIKVSSINYQVLVIEDQ